MYITLSFKGFGQNRDAVEQLCSLVQRAGWEDFCFLRDAENYQKTFDSPQALMSRSREEITKSDALLLDMTEGPTGRAIEAGIAYALGKKVIVIMKNGTVIKDTVRGIADAVVEYNFIEDIISPLNKLLKQWA